MTLTYFVIFSLATWRIASFFAQEAGPWNIFIKLREKAGIEHDEGGNVLIVPERFLAGVLSCVWCASVWVAMGWMLFWVFMPELAFHFAVMFGLSAMACALNKFIDSA